MKIYLVLIQIIIIHGNDLRCDYWVKRSDDKIDLCLNNECEKYVDPYWILVRPLDCKTNSLSLRFSTYEKYKFFLKNLQWKLSDLFPSKRISNETRKLNIYIENIHSNDQLINQEALNHLGFHLDYLYFYLQNVPSNHSLYPFIDYQSNWDIIQIQFDCNSLRRLDESICSTRIVPPSIFSPRRPLIISQSSTEQMKEEEESRLIDLIMFIGIPLLILLIIIFISIFILKKLLQNRLKTNKEKSFDENEGNAQPYQISQLPLPHLESIYRDISNKESPLEFVND